MQFRMGINLGDVIIWGGDLPDDGVNVAARIQTTTAPGGICISGSVHDQIQNKLSLNFKLLGEQTYKNIAKPARTYTINEGAGYWGYQQYDAHCAEQLRIDARLAAHLTAGERGDV
jgi:adenylate cyclase